ncbi:MAG: choice-of-anchor V domain-containing protein [Bacteroidota bacterium]
MKKICKILIFVFIPAISLLLAFTQGPPAGYTGSPLDGQDCTLCHTPLPAGNMENWITTSIPATGYTSDETYSITVTAIGIVAVKMGFQITSETTSDKIGEFFITDPDRTQLESTTTVTHTAVGTEVIEIPNYWSMDWKAPAAGTGAITFYAAVNQTNDDNTSNGDLIYVSSLNVEESTISIAEHLQESIGQIYPNPASSYINVSLPQQSVVKIIDNIGREVMHVTTNTNELELDISGLDQGKYYMLISHEEISTTRSFIKR